MERGELAPAATKEDETVIRGERSRYNSRVFISSDVYTARTYASYTFANPISPIGRRVFREFPSSFRLAFAGYVGSICRATRNRSSVLSRYRYRAPRLASKIDDGTPPLARRRRRIHSPSIVHILARYLRLPNNPSRSMTSARRTGVNSSPNGASSASCLSCRAPFNESGISSVLSPTTRRTVRNRIRTRCCILMVASIALPVIFPCWWVVRSHGRIAAAIISVSFFRRACHFYISRIIYFLEYFPIVVIFHCLLGIF